MQTGFVDQHSTLHVCSSKQSSVTEYHKGLCRWPPRERHHKNVLHFKKVDFKKTLASFRYPNVCQAITWNCVPLLAVKSSQIGIALFAFNWWLVWIVWKMWVWEVLENFCITALRVVFIYNVLQDPRISASASVSTQTSQRWLLGSILSGATMPISPTFLHFRPKISQITAEMMSFFSHSFLLLSNWLYGV